MSLKKLAFIFFFLNIIFLYSSYSQKYTAIDSIVLKYPKFGSTEKLAKRIQEDFTSEHDKARAIYSWIALNLNYDLKTYLNPPKQKSYKYKNESDWAKQLESINANKTQKAFRSRKGVCEGFSLLYAYIGTLVGLKCQVITGDSKRLLSDIGRKKISSNHAWNTVQIDGKWILVDATWGQGFYDDKRKVMVKEFTPIYFDMSPQYFFAKHFPDSGIFSDHKMNKTDFLNGPLIYDETIREDYEIILPHWGIVEANEGDKITFKIKNISRFDDIYYLNKKDEKIKIENLKEENGVLEFQITYNKKLGRFITFYIYQHSLASFKIVPKTI
jgi:hypothetical protein